MDNVLALVRSRICVYLAMFSVLTTAVTFAVQVRSNSFNKHSDPMHYAPLQAVQTVVRSEVDCAGLCTGNSHCVVFGFSAEYSECILAGASPVKHSMADLIRADLEFYYENNGCASLDPETIYFKPLGMCVRKLPFANIYITNWQSYRDACLAMNLQNRLVELSDSEDFYYALSVVFASDFFPVGKFWVGAKGLTDGTAYVMEWVSETLPVKQTFWDYVVTPTRAGGDDDDDDDDESQVRSPEAMCGYLEKTVSGVYLRMADCTAGGAGDFYGLCSRKI